MTAEPIAKRSSDLARPAGNSDWDPSTDEDRRPVSARQVVAIDTMRYIWAIAIVLAVLAVALVYGLTI